MTVKVVHVAVSRLPGCNFFRQSYLLACLPFLWQGIFSGSML